MEILAEWDPQTLYATPTPKKRRPTPRCYHDRPRFGRGLCQPCYFQLKRNGGLEEYPAGTRGVRRY